jgi:hypothetical protein
MVVVGETGFSTIKSQVGHRVTHGHRAAHVIIISHAITRRRALADLDKEGFAVSIASNSAHGVAVMAVG